MNRLWLAVALALAWTGCVVDPERCCDRFSPSDDAGIYCIAHKDVIVRFVKEARDPADQRARLEWCKGLMVRIEPLPDSDTINDRIVGLGETHREFLVQYEKQHFWAGRDTNLGLQQRGILMKCGFRHGIHEMDLELSR